MDKEWKKRNWGYRKKFEKFDSKEEQRSESVVEKTKSGYENFFFFFKVGTNYRMLGEWSGMRRKLTVQKENWKAVSFRNESGWDLECRSKDEFREEHGTVYSPQERRQE